MHVPFLRSQVSLAAQCLAAYGGQLNLPPSTFMLQPYTPATRLNRVSGPVVYGAILEMRG